MQIDEDERLHEWRGFRQSFSGLAGRLDNLLVLAWNHSGVTGTTFVSRPSALLTFRSRIEVLSEVRCH